MTILFELNTMCRLSSWRNRKRRSAVGHAQLACQFLEVSVQTLQVRLVAAAALALLRVRHDRQRYTPGVIYRAEQVR